MRRTHTSIGIAALIAIALAGCGGSADQASTDASDSLLAASPVETPQGDLTPQTDYQSPPAPTPAKKPSTPSKSPSAPRPTPVSNTVTIPAGTGIKVAVTTKVSSETSLPGESWSGTVVDNVIVGDRVVIPAGSTVTGTVAGAEGAQRGSRAFLVLAVRSIDVDGRSYSIGANTDSIIAGSTRARNLGAIAGGAAAGALIGKAVGGSGKGAVIGGLIGGAAAGGAVAASKGYQVVIKEGTEITFSTREAEQIARR